jgi:hypothetical protein
MTATERRHAAVEAFVSRTCGKNAEHRGWIDMVTTRSQRRGAKSCKAELRPGFTRLSRHGDFQLFALPPVPVVRWLYFEIGTEGYV